MGYRIVRLVVQRKLSKLSQNGNASNSSSNFFWSVSYFLVMTLIYQIFFQLFFVSVVLTYTYAQYYKEGKHGLLTYYESEVQKISGTG